MRTAFSAVLFLQLFFSAFTAIPAASQQGNPQAIFKAWSERNKANDHAGALAEAQRLETVSKGMYGARDPRYATSLLLLSHSSRFLGRVADAETYLLSAVRIYETANHRDVEMALSHLASLYQSQSRLTDAERTYQRVIVLAEKANSERLGRILRDLGSVYKQQGKLPEAEAIVIRALSVHEKQSGADQRDVAGTLMTLADIYEARGKGSDAETQLKRALAIYDKLLGPGNQDSLAIRSRIATNEARKTGNAINYFGVNNAPGSKPANAFEAFDNALRLAEQRLADQEKTFGSESLFTMAARMHLAQTYLNQNRRRDAAAQYGKAIPIAEKAVGADHPAVADIYSRYAGAQDSFEQTLLYSRKAADILIRRSQTDLKAADHGPNTDTVRIGTFFTHLYNLSTAQSKQDKDGIKSNVIGEEALQIAQWTSQSTAASAIQQMGARFAASGGVLATIVREQQDLITAREKIDRELSASFANPDQTKAVDGTALRKRLDDIDAKISTATQRLEREFPDYAALANPRPLSIEAIQKLLGPDEALAFFLTGETRSYVFAVNKERFSWAPINDTLIRIANKVSLIRDALNVDDLNLAIATGSKAKPFDFTTANELHNQLFDKIASTINGKKHLIVVPTGPLTALPFHALVTSRSSRTLPDENIGPAHFAIYAEASWLMKRFAISVLPSIGSLQALRSLPRTAQAGKSMIGFADPVFSADAERKAAAAKSQQAEARSQRDAAKTRAYTDYWRGAGLNRDTLAQALPRLEDTADEVKAVATNLGTAADIYLRANATEAAVKKARLADYRIVYFATHGLVAGDVKGVGEPSLALTIPTTPSDLDDGLLTASEVALLKLNAEWVVLSACNTIAGETPGAEALSGLTRSFFYAGAKALLVSHWAVDSLATTRLTTTAFDVLAKNPAIGRAEALRRAMLDFVRDTASPKSAHPAYWAPFVVIGEGGSAS